MKYVVAIACLLVFASCAKAPDPQIAKLETKIAQLELDLANTKTLIMAMEGSQTASENVVKIQSELIQQLATAPSTEQLRGILLEYIELSQKRDAAVDQKLALLAKQVFGEEEATRRGLILH